MRHFRVTFIKIPKIVGAREPAQFLDQEYFTDKDTIDINTPAGYGIVSVIEYLEPINQFSNEKKTLKN